MEISTIASLKHKMCNARLPVGRLNAVSSPCFIAQDANALLCSSHFIPCPCLFRPYLCLGLKSTTLNSSPGVSKTCPGLIASV